MAFGDDDYNVFSEFKEASGFNASITVGRELNRLLGIRLQTNWMRMHNRVNLEVYEYHKEHNPELVPNKGFYGYNVLQSSAELTFNLTNLIFPNSNYRRWDCQAFIGPGVTYTMNYDKIVKRWKTEHVGYDVDDNNHVLWNANIGGNIEYKITPHIGINAEVMCSFTGDKLEGVKYEEFYDAIITYSLGVSYHF